jgi:mannose-6-phosphate isomerase-like protein (cupin superfamily)
MIRTGQTIENPVTGERLRFLKTSRDTGGESVVVEVTVQPDGFVAAAHVHPFQTEHFEILEGTVGFRLGREQVELSAGESVVVEPGTPHKFWNAGAEEARFVTVVRPALQFEQLIETMFGLAEDGKTNRKGMPNPFRLAVIANEHLDDVRLPVVPASLQRAALAMGAPLGRMLGYRATYETVPSFGVVAAAKV